MKPYPPPVVCGWCHTWLKPPEKGSPEEQPVSHGICPTCLKQHFPEPPRRRWALVRVQGWAKAARRAVGQAVQRGGGLWRW